MKNIEKWLKDEVLLDNASQYPVYLQLHKQLVELIHKHYKEFRMFPKDAEMVELLGVSRDSIQKAMKMLVEDGYVLRIKRKGTFINEDKLAEAPFVKNNVIGVIWPHSNDWFRSLADMEKCASEYGYSLDIRAYEWSSLEDQINLLKDLSQTCAGIIIYPSCAANAGIYLNKLAASGYPLHLFDICPDGVELPLVTADSFSGVKEMVGKMLANGYERIAFLGTGEKLSTVQERLAGWKAAIPDYNESLICIENKFAAVTDFLKKEKPDAVFCANHEQITCCLRYAAENGLRIPEDLGLAAFDSKPEDEFLNPPLSVISQPVKMMGRIVVEAFIQQLEEKPEQVKNIYVPVEVIPRKSIAKNSKKES